MRLDNFDLNLLIALEVLLEERSVTRAAERLNITQSAMSAALKRLRFAFGDELLVLHGKRMIPTPRAQEIGPSVSSAIHNLRSLLLTGAAFHPPTSQRRFRISASDYIATVLIAPLLEILEEEAAGIRLDISLPDATTNERLANGEIDLLLTPEQFLHPNHPRDLLFTERHVVVGWSGNSIMHKPMTMEEFLASRHVAVQISESDTFIEAALREKGIIRNIEVRVPSFIQAPWLLPGTQRLALMHERLARQMAPRLSLAISEPPLDLPVMREMMQFHTTHQSDSGLTWLRQKILDLADTRTSITIST